jgi:hypothetical protein
MSLTVPEHARSGFLEEGLVSSLPFGTAHPDAGDELNVIAAFKISMIQPRDLTEADYTELYVEEFEVKADRIEWVIKDKDDNIVLDTNLLTHEVTSGFDDYTYGWVITEEGSYLCYAAYTAGLADVLGSYNYGGRIAPFSHEIIPEQVDQIIAVGYELNEDTEWKPGYPQWPSLIPDSALEEGDDIGFPDDGQIEFLGEYQDPGTGQMVPYVDKEVGWPEDGFPESVTLGSWVFTGEVIFLEGYNMDLTDNVDNSSVYFVANPGAGLGYGPDCDVSTDYIYTINNQGPDTYGNVNLASGDCISITRPGEFEEPPLDGVYTCSQSSNQLHIRGDCSICCSCEDFEAVYRALRLLNLRMAGYEIAGIDYDGVNDRIQELYNQYNGLRTKFVNEKSCRVEEVIQISQVYGHAGYFISVQVYVQNNNKCALAQVGPSDFGIMTVEFSKHFGAESLGVRAIEGSFWLYSDRDGGNPQLLEFPDGPTFPGQTGIYQFGGGGLLGSHVEVHVDLQDIASDRNNKLNAGRYLMFTSLWYVSDHERHTMTGSTGIPVTIHTTARIPTGDGGITNLDNEQDLLLVANENLGIDTP